jgi:ribose transport system permease protein
MKKIAGMVLLYYRYFLLLVLIIMASVMIGDPIQNFINVLTLQAPYVFIYSFGMTIVMLTGGLDLSQGSVAALSSCIGAMFIIKGQLFLGALITLAIGAAVGVVNGFLVTKLKVPSFITTYGMDWVVRGLVHIIMGGLTIFGFNETFRRLSRGTFLGISNLFYFALVILVVMLFVFQKTIFGRNVYMIGSNVKVAQLSGVKTDRTITIVYMISGVLAAFAGLLYVSRLDAAEAFLGKNYGITALAASLIGGTALDGGKGGVGNTVVGVLIMVFLTNVLNVWKVPLLWQDAAFGFVIAGAALLEKARSAYSMTLLD